MSAAAGIDGDHRLAHLRAGDRAAHELLEVVGADLAARRARPGGALPCPSSRSRPARATASSRRARCRRARRRGAGSRPAVPRARARSPGRAPCRAGRAGSAAAVFLPTPRIARQARRVARRRPPATSSSRGRPESTPRAMRGPTPRTVRSSAEELARLAVGEAVERVGVLAHDEVRPGDARGPRSGKLDAQRHEEVVADAADVEHQARAAARPDDRPRGTRTPLCLGDRCSGRFFRSAASGPSRPACA